MSSESTDTTQDEVGSSPKNNRITRSSLRKSKTDETEKLIINETVLKKQSAKSPRSSLRHSSGSNDHVEIVIQQFDPNMFDKFETRQLNFRRSSQPQEANSDMDKLVQEIHNSIDQSASKMLFSWHNLPIIFPPPIADISNIDLNSLFKFPTFDELDEVAVDANGKRKRLNEQQFESIKRRGEFEVDSNRFEGKKHKWVLSRLLQKGYENSNNSFFKDMSNSLHLMIVTAKRRFCYRYFSVLDGVKSIGRSVYDFIDLLIGLPQMRTIDYQSKLNLEKIKFLVAELKIDPSQEEEFNKLCSQLNIALENDVYTREKWTFPHFYKGPDNLVVDLRLYDNELQNKIAPILKELLKIDTNEKLFLNNLRDESIILFANEGLKDYEITERTTKIVYKEYLKRLYNRLANSSKLESISPGIGKLLCEHVQAIRAIEQVCDDIVNEFSTHMKSYEDRLRKEHRVKSLVSEWLQARLDEEKERYLKEKAFLIHQKALEKCGEERLFQATYFIIREMIFYRDHEKDLIEKFKKEKEPTKFFRFFRYIWFPKNYIIEKSTYTNDYIAKKEVEYTSSNNYPFWRWKNFFIRTFVYFSNLFFIFGIVIPFASPVSFSALFRPNPFYPGKIVNKKTGQLEVDPNSKTLTYFSRLRSIWQHVGKSIDKFESIPDKGLISKNVQRIFNRVWNYVIKGFFGSVLLTLVFPPMCLISSIGSLLLFVTSPIWFPILNILGHLFLIFIFDLDYAYGIRWLRFFKIVLFDFLLRGLVQPIVALTTATVICPIASFTLLLFGLCRKALRKTWDSFMFYAVIKRQAKIPSSDTFLARRVAGPGLSSNYFYQARAEQVLVTLEAHLEAKMLRAYYGFIERGLKRPLNAYTQFFNPLFNRYSYHLEMSRGPYMDLNSNVNHYIDIYSKEMAKRTKVLDSATQDPKIKSIRLVEKDLDPLLIEATKVVKKHYEEILKYQQKDAKSFFEEKGMSLNDWEGLTKTELEDLFGVGIITPLEHTDVYFSLNVDHLNLGKYSKMIADSNIRDDLDSVHVNYNPKRSRNPTFQIQEESIELFDPRREFNVKCNQYDHKNHSAWTKMTIPTKLPGHLGVTALLVEHVNKTATSGGNGEKFKYTYDQVINAVNKNDSKAKQLV